MGKIRVAVPTKNKKGLEGIVSEVFGRTKYFTLVDLEGGSIERVEVLENPHVEYKHGTGPLVVKMLADHGVDIAIAQEVGPGASTLLEQNNIELFKIEAGPSVSEVLKLVMERAR